MLFRIRTFSRRAWNFDVRPLTSLLLSMFAGLSASMVPSRARADCASVTPAIGSILTPTSGYVVADDLRPGDFYYTDRSTPGSHVIVAAPSQLDCAQWIKTRNDDKNASSLDFLQFTVTVPSLVYVGYDTRALALPVWLTSEFTNTGLILDVNDPDPNQEFAVWRKEVAAGTVVLGGNKATGAQFPTCCASNYVVVVKAGGGIESQRVIREQSNGQTEDTPTYSWRSCSGSACGPSNVPGATITLERPQGQCKLEIFDSGDGISSRFAVFYTAFSLNASEGCPWQARCSRVCQQQSCYREGFDAPRCPQFDRLADGTRELFDPRAHDACCIRNSGVDFFCFRGGVQQIESAGQGDDDGVAGACDNCPSVPNGPGRGTCRAGFRGLACQRDLDCGLGGRCSLEQEDLNQNGVGDVCEPCGDVNEDGGVDATDAATILKSRLRPPPANLRFNAALCDVNADGRCDASDATTILKSKLRPPTATVQQTCAGAPSAL